MAGNKYDSELFQKVFGPDVQFEGAEDASPELKRAIQTPAENHRRVPMSDAIDNHRGNSAIRQDKALEKFFSKPAP